MDPAVNPYEKGKSQFGAVLRSELDYVKLRWRMVYSRWGRADSLSACKDRLVAA